MIAIIEIFRALYLAPEAVLVDGEEFGYYKYVV